MNTHFVGLPTDTFDNIWSCAQTFVIIKQGTDPKNGDILVLQERDNQNVQLSQKELVCKVLYVLTESYGLQSGYLILSIEVVNWLNPKIVPLYKNNQ